MKTKPNLIVALLAVSAFQLFSFSAFTQDPDPEPTPAPVPVEEVTRPAPPPPPVTLRATLTPEQVEIFRQLILSAGFFDFPEWTAERPLLRIRANARPDGSAEARIDFGPEPEE